MQFYVTIDAASVRDYMPADPGLAYLFPASSFAARRRDTQRTPAREKPLPVPRLPPEVRANAEIAADSGGFVASFRHGGEYQYSVEQYVEWLHALAPSWAALRDWCCEAEITGTNDGVVRQRQRRTTETAWAMWSEYKRAPWCWVPTVQGWEVADYQTHARQLRPLIEEMRDYYGRGSSFRVGIGTLCRRANVRMIHEVVNAVASELGPETPLHLWGIKLGALQSRVALPASVVSVDSAAWDGLAGSRDRRDYEAYRDAGRGTQAQFSLTEALPRYLAKVDKALDTVKQQVLLTA